MSDRLVINEIYASVQGESTFAGLPCVFVRTTGCPLRCVWCDTEHAFYEGQPMSIADVTAKVQSYGIPLVEITGGEPLVQSAVLPLMSRLADAGKTVLLETSGAYDISAIDPRVRIIMDLKCPDSGESSRNRWENVPHLKPIDEVKFVLASERDYQYARGVVGDYRLDQKCSVLFSTVFDKLPPRHVVEWILRDGLPVRFQLQLHKFIWPAETRGV